MRYKISNQKENCISLFIVALNKNVAHTFKSFMIVGIVCKKHLLKADRSQSTQSSKNLNTWRTEVSLMLFVLVSETKRMHYFVF